MGLQVVGAGLGRTGTTSLKGALERLLGGPCYHMIETHQRPADRIVWERAFRGDPPDWVEFFAGYRATVDWPSAGVWHQIADAHPDALILLSVRSAEDWWRSASRTIFPSMAARIGSDLDDGLEHDPMSEAMMAIFTPDFMDETAAKAAYLAHNDDVRATVEPGRLLEWHPGDGWGPLASALGVVRAG